MARVTQPQFEVLSGEPPDLWWRSEKAATKAFRGRGNRRAAVGLGQSKLGALAADDCQRATGLARNFFVRQFAQEGRCVWTMNGGMARRRRCSRTECLGRLNRRASSKSENRPSI